MKERLTISYWMKDWKESWEILELARIMKKYKLTHNVEVPQDEVDSTFMLFSNQELTEKDAQELWEAGLEFFDDESTLSGKNLKEVKEKLAKIKEQKCKEDEE